MRTLPLDRVYQFIEPGPVVLLTTRYRDRANVMAMSWHMMVDFEPPQLACIVSDANESFVPLRKTRECVIAIPPAGLARTVVDIGNCSGRDVDKFARFGLDTKPARRVAAPLLPACFANLECRVIETRLVNAFCLFVLEVLQAWVEPRLRGEKTLHHQGYGRFVLDGDVVRVPSRKP